MIENLFLGVGAMKAGTTWITSNLRTHKDIYFTYEKELSYFAYLHAKNCQFALSEEMRMRKVDTYVSNIKKSLNEKKKVCAWGVNFLSNPIDDLWYVNNFALRGTETYCADFSNLYAHLDAAGWRHAKRLAKNLKVVYIMRDPLSRLWSHIRFQLGLDNQLHLLETWTKDELYRYAKQEHIWRNTKYFTIVKTMQENLSKEQLYVGFYEMIKIDPQKLLNEIESFLQIEQRKYDVSILQKKINTSQIVIKPDFFDELFIDELSEEVKNLKKLNINIPNTWKVK